MRDFVAQDWQPVLAANGLGSFEAVWALDIGWLTGNQVVALLVGTAVLCLAGGSALWLRGNRPLSWKRRDAAKRAGIMLGLVILSIIAGLLKIPFVALILLLFSLIFVVSLIERLA